MLKHKTETINLGAFQQETLNTGMNWGFTTAYLNRQVVSVVVIIPLLLVVYYLTGSKLLLYPLIVVTSMVAVVVLPKLFPNPQMQPSTILEKFALDNNADYFFNPDYKSNGIIFLAGKGGHRTIDLLHGSLYGYEYNLYSHAFLVPNGSKTEEKQYGVVEIILPKHVPNIFLDYKKNNRAFNIELLDLFRNKDMLELEGDFNKYFRVFAPQKYVVAVLTLLNPQFMHVLIDSIKYDIELIGDRAFIYISDPVMPIIIGEENIVLMYSLAEVLILNLQKQLDTFTFHPKSMSDAELVTI